MVGEFIKSRRSFPLAVAFFVLVAVALDVLALVQGNIHHAIRSIGPWLIAALLSRARPRPFRARLTARAIETEIPPQTIPYAEMQGLRAPGRPANPYKAGPRAYPIEVLHTGGVLRIPARLNVPSDEVFSFLFRQFAPRGSRDVNPLLQGYRDAMESRYGRERVWTYRARASLGGDRRTPRLALFFFAIFLTGIIWVVFGHLTTIDDWFIAGMVAVILGGLFALLFSLQGRLMGRTSKTWQQSSLIICPEGLALVQGSLRGELKWDELRDAKLLGKPSFFRPTGGPTGPGIVIVVEGATIVIRDLYDCPLALIYQHIAYYWRGEDLPASPAGAWRPLDQQVPRSEDFDDGIQTI